MALDFLEQAGIFVYHRSMLADVVRIKAYAAAIAATVKPGDIVVDMGAGTGILSCLACKAGAAYVYAIESGPVIQLAKLMARENGFEDRIEFIANNSMSVDLPEGVDVAITETLGNFGLEEGLLDWVLDARRRFLKPGGLVVPRSVELFAVPIEVPNIIRGIEGWRDDVLGIRMGPLRDFAFNNAYPIILEWPSFLARPASLGGVDLETFDQVDFHGQASYEIHGSGTLHGFGGWFSSELSPGVSVSNEPPSPVPNWNHRFLPSQEPFEVRPGDIVRLSISTGAWGTRWSWKIELERPGEPRRVGPSQSTALGFPFEAP